MANETRATVNGQGDGDDNEDSNNVATFRVYTPSTKTFTTLTALEDYAPGAPDRVSNIDQVIVLDQAGKPLSLPRKRAAIRRGHLYVTARVIDLGSDDDGDGDGDAPQLIVFAISQNAVKEYQERAAKGEFNQRVTGATAYVIHIKEGDLDAVTAALAPFGITPVLRNKPKADASTDSAATGDNGANGATDAPSADNVSAEAQRRANVRRGASAGANASA